MKSRIAVMGVGEGVWAMPHGERKQTGPPSPLLQVASSPDLGGGGEETARLGNQREWSLWGPLWEVC